ncbi:hypothetical protein ACNKXS_03290 [Christiangramia marina]|uniref:hypothetical protein n=1 Tax=Christiangramia marina TaxID=409436 RepID=UPI003AA8381F
MADPFTGRNDRGKLGHIIENLSSVNYSRLHVEPKIVAADIRKQGYHFKCVDLNDDNASYVTYIILAFSFPAPLGSKETPIERIKRSPNFDIVDRALNELGDKLEFRHCGEYALNFHDFDTFRMCLEIDDHSF